MTEEQKLTVTDIERKAIAFCKEKEITFPIANYLVEFATETTKELKATYKKQRNKRIDELQKKNHDLEAQIEKMKCCENCEYREPYCEEAIRLPFGCCCEKWKLRR